jgi:hypothetical protein
VQCLNVRGRTEGVRKIAQRFGISVRTVQRISHPSTAPTPSRDKAKATNVELKASALNTPLGTPLPGPFIGVNRPLLRRRDTASLHDRAISIISLFFPALAAR